MQFVRLRLSGFKSFVDATELEIGEGLTGVVGPNGCGKSNLVEALRWVMGETSAKRIRGGAMDDVIFSGTQSRPARNVAEVALVVDNRDRSAPAAFNDADDLEISRAIERDSGSAYRINGAEVRARDVQLLFADAASGAHSPSLVSQGRIGAVVNAKPAERRALLEEAAGITGLHSRRHEAELRLRGAETNLERLDDVMQALEAQLQNIKRQARQANRYRRVGEQIRRAEGILLHLLHTRARQQIAEAEAQLREVTQKVGELTEAVAKANAAHVQAAEGLPALRQREAEAGARLHRLAVARDALEQEDQRVATAQEQLAQRLTQIDVDESRERQLAEDATTAMAKLEQERTGLTAAQAGEEATQTAAAARTAEAGAALEAQESELDATTDRLAKLTAERDALVRARDDAAARLTRLQARRQDGETHYQAIEAEVREDKTLQTTVRELDGARAAAEAARAQVEQAEARGRALDAAAQEKQDALRQQQAAADRLQAEATALVKLLQVGDADLWPPLIDAISVDPGFETALGAALGDDLQAPTDEAAPVHWRTMPPLTEPVALPAGVTPLSAHVQAPPALTRRLQQIGVVDDADGPRLMPQLRLGQRLVSRSGALWRWDGYTVTTGAETAAAARLAQRNRLEELRAEQAGLTPALQAAQAAHGAARNEAQTAASALATAREQARAADEALNRARDAHGAAEREAAGRSSRLLALQENLSQIAQDIEESRTAEADASQRLGGLPDLDAARMALGELRRQAAGLRSTLVEARNAEDQLRREAQGRADRIAAIDGEVRAWQARTQNAQTQINELQQRRAQAQGELEELRQKPAEIAARRQTLLQQIEGADDERKQAADALAQAEARVAELEKLLRQAETVLATAREDRVRAEAGCQQAEERRGDVVRRIDEALQCRPDEVLASAGIEADEELPPLEETETKLERLKRERDRMGPVNLRAEQEAAELQEQLQTMQSEREDLEGAIARLRRGISSLNREGRERLLAAFSQVDGHFQQLFVRLFGGGKAHLALTESDDPLEAGLEIMASPPGKRLQSLSLLSGGEQALTALSLLFAVFLTHPAPVCVLDEVDAPLDDANVERFCNLVTEIARSTGTRFLIITHHPYSMARMDRLFGVTMAERGVSQLVSVDLARAERIRATA